MTLTDRLDSYLDERDLAAVWFARPASFAWLTGGDNVVDRAGDHGVAAVGYDGSETTVVTDDIEGERIAAEELPRVDAAVETFPWHERSLAEAVAERSPEPAAADFDVSGFEPVADPAALRQPLTDGQIERYDELAGEAAAALEDVLRETGPADTELSVAASIRGAIEGLDAATPVVLVGGGERAPAYRHYTPTRTELGDYALASVTVERAGLHVSCTRTVAFDPPEWLDGRTGAAARVEASALAATRRAARAGGTAGDVFAAIREAYDAVGWAGEWRNHHQGGAAGFAGREWIGTPDHPAPVSAPMAYAWNPTVQGAKSEDTHLVTAESVETLSTTGEWPTRTVESVDGELTFDRPAPLSP